MRDMRTAWNMNLIVGKAQLRFWLLKLLGELILCTRSSCVSPSGHLLLALLSSVIPCWELKERTSLLLAKSIADLSSLIADCALTRQMSSSSRLNQSFLSNYLILILGDGIRCQIDRLHQLTSDVVPLAVLREYLSSIVRSDALKTIILIRGTW